MRQDRAAWKRSLSALVQVWTAQNLKYVHLSKSTLYNHTILDGHFPFQKLYTDERDLEALHQGSGARWLICSREQVNKTILLSHFNHSRKKDSRYQNCICTGISSWKKHMRWYISHVTKKKKTYNSTEIFANGDCSLNTYFVGAQIASFRPSLHMVLPNAFCCTKIPRPSSIWIVCMTSNQPLDWNAAPLETNTLSPGHIDCCRKEAYRRCSSWNRRRRP